MLKATNPKLFTSRKRREYSQCKSLSAMCASVGVYGFSLPTFSVCMCVCVCVCVCSSEMAGAPTV
jgi:hypothetical protein